MKKIIIILSILIILFITSNESNKEVLIPKESIRFRVIANSNSEKDQKDKRLVAKSLGNSVTTLLQNSNSLEESRFLLKNNINNFKDSIDETLKENNIQTDYNINYGENYFPEKEYKGVTYKEGDYESLVVTLGNGEGNNFWCVLFPPLCLLEGEETTKNNVEYKSLIKEVIDKYF